MAAVSAEYYQKRMAFCRCRYESLKEGVFLKKKGKFSAVLAMALLFSVIPVRNADASPIEVSGWDEWLEMSAQAADGTTYGFSIDADRFEWPETEETMVIEKELYFSGDWVIPENVTVIVKSKVHPDIVPVSIDESKTSSLTIYGTWRHSGREAGITETFSPLYYDHADVTIGEGGHFIIDEDTNHSQFPNLTVASGGTFENNAYQTYVGADSLIWLKSGSVVNGNGTLRLDGEIRGEGAVLNCGIVVWGGYSSDETAPTLSGELDISDIEFRDSSLTIAAGSSVSCDSLRMEPYAQNDSAVLNVNGNLDVQNGLDFSGDGKNQINIAGTLAIAGYSSVRGNGKSVIDISENGVLDVNGTLKFLSENGNITGNGTMKVYGTMEDDILNLHFYIPVDGKDVWIDDLKDQAVEKGYMSDAITIWKSWECDHKWAAGKVTEPTCSAEGYTTYTCELCGSTKKDAFTDKIPHTPDGNQDCTKPVYCTVCGEEIRPAGEHTYDSGTVKTEATCTQTGTIEYKCEECGAIKLEEIPEKGHQWKMTEEETEEGTAIINECTACGEKQVVILEAVQTVDVSLSVSALNALSEQADENGYEELRIQADVIDDNVLNENQLSALSNLSENALLLQITLEGVKVDGDGTEEVIPLHDLGGTAEIRVKYDMGNSAENAEVKTVYLAEDGTTEDIATVYKDGQATFVTTHFSEYAVYTAEKEKEPEGQEPSNPDGNTDPEKPSDSGKPSDQTTPDDHNGNGATDQKQNSPATGDKNALLFWAGLMMAAVLCGGRILYRRMN